MSKYKKGDKFIVELEEQVGNLWRIKGFNALVFDDFGLDKLKQVIDCVAVDERKKGQQEAWELAKNIVEEKINICKFFSMSYTSDVFKHYTYAEAAAKLEAWKERNEIHTV